MPAPQPLLLPDRFSVNWAGPALPGSALRSRAPAPGPCRQAVTPFAGDACDTGDPTAGLSKKASNSGLISKRARKEKAHRRQRAVDSVRSLLTTMSDGRSGTGRTASMLHEKP